MAISFNVPSNPHTTYNTTIDGGKYTFTFRWNARQKVWYLDVFTSGGTPIVLGSVLLENTELIRKVSSITPQGSLTIVNNTNTLDTPNRFNIGVGKDFELIYFTEEELNNAN